jgi:hypothetical protein
LPALNDAILAAGTVIVATPEAEKVDVDVTEAQVVAERLALALAGPLVKSVAVISNDRSEFPFTTGVVAGEVISKSGAVVSIFIVTGVLTAL